MRLDSLRRSCAAALLLFLPLAFGAPAEASAADAEETSAPPALSVVDYNDGDAWVRLELGSGSVEGSEGTSAAKALLKSQLGGPKTYFVVAGAASKSAVTVARPRFRIEGDEALARRVQLARFEVGDDARRTPIEVVKGATVFKRGEELERKKVGDGLWELRPKKSLQPGEYALTTSGDEPIVDFTIVERGY
jgi:hypothetical protein